MPDEPGGRKCITLLSKFEEQLHERHAERVLAMTGLVTLPVCLVQGLVLDRDVGRIPYDDVVAAAVEDAWVLGYVFIGVGE